MLVKYVVLATALGLISSKDSFVTADYWDLFRRGLTEEQEIALETTPGGSPSTTRKLRGAAPLTEDDEESDGGEFSTGNKAEQTEGDDIDKLLNGIMAGGSRGGSSSGMPDMNVLLKGIMDSSAGGTMGGSLTGKGLADIDKMMKGIMEDGSDASTDKSSKDDKAYVDEKEDKNEKEDTAKDGWLRNSDNDASDYDTDSSAEFLTGDEAEQTEGDNIDKLLNGIMAGGSRGGSSSGMPDMDVLLKGIMDSSAGGTMGGSLTGKGLADIDKMMKGIMEDGSDASTDKSSKDDKAYVDEKEDKNEKEDTAKDGWLRNSDNDASDYDTDSSAEFLTGDEAEQTEGDDIDKLLNGIMAGGSTGGSSSGMPDMDVLLKGIMDSSAGGTMGGSLTGKGLADIDKMMKGIMEDGSDASTDKSSKDDKAYVDEKEDKNEKEDTAKDGWLRNSDNDASDYDTDSSAEFLTGDEAEQTEGDDIDKLLNGIMAGGSTSGSSSGMPDMDVLLKGIMDSSAGGTMGGSLTGKGLADIDKMMKGIMDEPAGGESSGDDLTKARKDVSEAKKNDSDKATDTDSKGTLADLDPLKSMSGSDLMPASLYADLDKVRTGSVTATPSAASSSGTDATTAAPKEHLAGPTCSIFGKASNWFNTTFRGSTDNCP